MRTVELGGGEMRASVLGFGCSAVLGRVGRKASLAALGAALDAGVTLFDTARSYGYGEAEALLGEFLRGRRDSVVISTKFGILPAPSTLLKRSLKPVARSLLRWMPAARDAVRGRVAAQFSPGHFTVRSLHDSLEASLRALRTDYVDLLFMHEAPAGVLQKEDLLAALEAFVAEGKVRRFGIASNPAVVDAALAADLPGLRSVQSPCNLFDMGLAQLDPDVAQLDPARAQRMTNRPGDVAVLASRPFGGGRRIAEGKALLRSLARSPGAPDSLREKLSVVDEAVLADATLNAITRDTAVQVVVPSMMRLHHLRANVAAIERSRFSSEELHWLRSTLASRTQPQTRETP